MRRREKIKLATLCYAVLLEYLFSDEKNLENAVIKLVIAANKRKCQPSWGITRRKIADMLSTYQRSLERGESPATASKKAFDCG